MGRDIKLEPNLYYRYISPSPYSKNSLADLFYGQRRSFSKGHIFDDSDIIIEFSMNSTTENSTQETEPILHHPGSYIGRLSPDNTTVKRVFLRPLNDILYCGKLEFFEAIGHIKKEFPCVEFLTGEFPTIDLFLKSSSKRKKIS